MMASAMGPVSQPDLVTAALRSFLALALVLALLFLIVFLYQKYLAGAPTRQGQRRWIKILASCTLGGHKSITVVEVGEEIIVLGVTDQQISLLTKLPREAFGKSEASTLNAMAQCRMQNAE